AQVAAADAQLVAALHQGRHSCRIEMGDFAQVEDDAPRLEGRARERVVDGPDGVAIELAANGDGGLRLVPAHACGARTGRRSEGHHGERCAKCPSCLLPHLPSPQSNWCNRAASCACASGARAAFCASAQRGGAQTSMRSTVPAQVASSTRPACSRRLGGMRIRPSRSTGHSCAGAMKIRTSCRTWGSNCESAPTLCVNAVHWPGAYACRQGSRMSVVMKSLSAPCAERTSRNREGRLVRPMAPIAC